MAGQFDANLEIINRRQEALISVNGQALTSNESMAVRVAVANMALTLKDARFRLSIGLELAAQFDRLVRNVQRAMGLEA